VFNGGRGSDTRVGRIKSAVIAAVRGKYILMGMIDHDNIRQFCVLGEENNKSKRIAI